MAEKCGNYYTRAKMLDNKTMILMCSVIRHIPTCIFFVFNIKIIKIFNYSDLEVKFKNIKFLHLNSDLLLTSTLLLLSCICYYFVDPCFIYLMNSNCFYHRTTDEYFISPL